MPVTIDVNGTLIVACGRPFDFASTSVVSAVYHGNIEYVLVPPTQIDVFIDGEIAIRAAVTGHLVFSTIHTNDAPGVLTRLTDMGISSYFVADALIGVISQRLGKRLCPACNRKGKTNAVEMKMLGIDEPTTICRPKGCQFCNGTGYRGRIAVHEIMYLNDKIREALATDISAEQLRDLVRESGMTPMWGNCKDYVFRGITSV